MNAQVIWLEIPVSDMNRAKEFYEKLLNTTIELRVLFDTPMALFSKEAFGIKGSLILVENHQGSNGIKPIIYIDIMADSMEIVEQFGGKVIKRPTLLRQKNKNGEIIIGTNLIDNQVGYYAEIQDCEGNHLYLYSHS